MSSISVRFNSFLFLYSIFNEHKAPCSSFWKASCFFSRHCRVVGLDGLEPSTSRLSGVRSNHLSYKPFSSRSFGIGSRHLSVSFCRLVEMMGFEPMTPCLQGRCSPSWATPPFPGCFRFFKDLQALACSDLWKLNNKSSILASVRNASRHSSTPISPWKDIMVSIERRWSSRTFRYGYLVTT